VSGGFATVHPNNLLTINAVEAAPLEDFSLEVPCSFLCSSISYADFQAVRANLSEAQRVASGTGSETDKIEAQIEISVYEALQAALAK
jgi:F-type H+-transporting ATPase subunit delta